MDIQSKNHTVRNLTILIVLVYALGWIGRGLDTLAGASAEGGPGILLWLLAPPVISFLLRAFAGDGWKDLGLKPALKRNVWWYVLSLLVYPVCTLFVLVAGSAFGAVSLDNFSMGLFVQAVAAASVMALFTAIEEFGWRGYLAPKVYQFDLNPFVAHAIVGVLWGAWHIPYFSAFWSHSMQNVPLFLLCFFVGAIVHSIVYGEIRMQTDSVWPAFLMHAVSNAVNNTLLLEGFVKMTSGRELLVSPGIEGILGIVFLALFGIGIYSLRRKNGTSV